MKLRAVTVVALFALALGACEDDAPAPTDKSAADTPAKAAPQAEKKDAHAAFTNLSVKDVDGLIAEKKCVPVDANGANTRSEYGTLPDAVLLSGSKYKVDELPSDKSSKLVFYCGSEKCSAAPRAAKLAKDAGYTDVNVMRAGIRGWVKAGKKVSKPST